MHLIPILLGWAIAFGFGGSANEHNVWWIIGAWLGLNLFGIIWGCFRVAGRNRERQEQEDSPSEYDLSIKSDNKEYNAVVSLLKRK